jgi:hypothetical protein
MSTAHQISEDYLKIQTELHKIPTYGTASLIYAPLVANLVRACGLTSISDYGAGKKNLLVGLTKEGIHPTTYLPYDPVFPEYGEPQTAQLVCCIDVLEHIEPELLDNVMDDLARITTTLGFFTIHMGPAKKVLSDGRNAHLIQKPSSWWLEKLIKFFDVLHLESNPIGDKGFYVIVSPRVDLGSAVN